MNTANRQLVTARVRSKDAAEFEPQSSRIRTVDQKEREAQINVYRVKIIEKWSLGCALSRLKKGKEYLGRSAEECRDSELREW